MNYSPAPILIARDLTLSFGALRALESVSLEIHPGEVLAIVGESGSGKTTLLNTLYGVLAPDAGEVRFGENGELDRCVQALPRQQLRHLHRSAWGYVHQNPRDALRMEITAGGNIVERLMAAGEKHYGTLREKALFWLQKVEIDPKRIDDLSGNLLGRDAATTADRQNPDQPSLSTFYGRTDQWAGCLGAGGFAGFTA